MSAVQSGMFRRRATVVITATLGLFTSVLCACTNTPGGEQCTELRLAPQVYYGTPGPTFVPLTPGQIQAIGEVGPCSGTLIAPTFALSADHCNHTAGTRFCMGVQPDAADRCVEVLEVIRDPAPGSDLVVLRLAGDARDVLPTVEPIPVLTEPLDDSWLGEIAEGSGYGETEEETYGTRFFTAEPIVAIDQTFIYVDGQGAHGLCGGDSGGPLLVIASDHTARVAGALYGGDTSCVGMDQYSRIDPVTRWIEGLAGPTQVGASYCGAIDAIGMCSGDRAIYCADGQLTSARCGASESCGWDEATVGFRCISGDDPCAGVDRRGACIAQVATWCEGGVLRERDCRACGERCYIAGSPAGAYCISDQCAGLDYLGRCDGDVAEWCDGGRLRSVDCADSGQQCGYVDDSIGYYCM